MKNLVTVGGIPYSGKSTFCRKIMDSNPSRYAYIEADKVPEYLNKNGAAFMDLIKRHDEELYLDIRKFGRDHGVHKKSKQAKILANFFYLDKTKARYDEYSNLYNIVTMMHMADLLKNLDENVTPLLEVDFTNKNSRIILYDKLLIQSIDMFDLDDVNKVMVYFNLGLDSSLERYKLSDRKVKKGIIYNEKVISERHEGQELPESDEWPNLEVIIVNTHDEIESAVERVASLI